MQTFLPYPGFEDSARALDYRRLGKQRLEARQLHDVLTGKRSGWASHPAAKMWRGHADALALYHNVVIEEWVRRGYRNNMPFLPVSARPSIPSWVGDAAFHASHRSNLLRKDPTFYGRHGWSEGPDLPYVWPTA